MTYTLDDGTASKQALAQFLQDVSIAVTPRFIAESVLGCKIEPSEAEKQAMDEACERLKAAGCSP